MLALADKIAFIRRVFGTHKVSRDGRNVDVRCPICAPRDRSKLKLSILTDDFVIDKETKQPVPVCLGSHCWTCGYRSRTLWYLLREHGTQEQLLEFRDKFLPESLKYRAHELDTAEVKPEKLKLPDDFRLLATSTSNDPDVRAIRNYLLTRDISDRDVWFYKLGYSHEGTWRRRVIMPSFDAEGELNLFVGRAIDKHRFPKYEMPEGRRDHVIFNALNIDWGKQVVLCEGPFDVVKCGDNAIPMLGSDLSTSGALFNALVAHSTPVALAMDADMRTTKLPIVAQKLLKYGIDLLIVDVEDDPGSMSKKTFKAALAKARPFEWRQAFLDKLDRATRVSL